MYLIIIYDIILSTYKLKKAVKIFLNKRLKEIRESQGYSQTAIANQLGVTRSAYSNWELGKRKSNQNHLQDLAKLFKIKVTDFIEKNSLLEKYSKLTSTNQKKLKYYVDKLLSDQQQKEKILLLYSIKALDNISLSAGTGEGFYDEYEAVEVFTNKNYRYDVAIWIKGDSMEPIYHNGDVTLIQLGGFDYEGATYAISWNEQLYIKKVYLEYEGYRLVSLNKKYEGKIICNFTPH